MKSPARIVLLGSGANYNKHISLLSRLVDGGEIEICGVTSDAPHITSIDGYRFIRKEALKEIPFDFIVNYTGMDILSTKNDIILNGIPLERFVNANVIDLPGFSFCKYSQLVQSKVSIISNNCWGGVTYNYFGLQFLSPFINMFVDDSEYIRLLSTSFRNAILNQDLVFEDAGYNPALDIKYPIYSLNGTRLYMNHYRDFEYAKTKWRERIARINWNNLFVEMYTESEKTAKEFDKLPYDKKICFVPFETDVPSCMTIQPYEQYFKGKLEFWEIVNRMANGKFIYYDPWELLLNGRKCYRVTMR